LLLFVVTSIYCDIPTTPIAKEEGEEEQGDIYDDNKNHEETH
jgi:hypothetical protein